MRNPVMTEFQFLKGSIQARRICKGREARKQFQFLKGSIQAKRM